MKFTCEVKKFDTFTRDLELVVELITVLAAIQLSKSVRSWYTQYLTDSEHPWEKRVLIP